MTCALFLISVDKQGEMDIEGDVLKTPIGVPQSFTYKKDYFYIRPCYDEYYRHILGLLYGPNDYDYISVTGC